MSEHLVEREHASNLTCLWGAVEDCPNHGHRESLVIRLQSLAVIEYFTLAKVCDFALHVLRDQHVVGFQVSVNDGLVEAVVEMLESEDESARELKARGCPRSHHALAIHSCPEGSFGAELKHKAKLVSTRVPTAADKLHEVRVVKWCHDGLCDNQEYIDV